MSKSKWFIKIRWSYLPNSGAGWLTYIPYLAYLIIVPILVYRDSSSWTLTVFITLPNWVAASVVMSWLASHES